MANAKGANDKGMTNGRNSAGRNGRFLTEDNGENEGEKKEGLSPEAWTSVDLGRVVYHRTSDMAGTEISAGRFTKEFRAVRDQALVVTDRGEVLGTWIPARRKRVVIDFEKRARADSAAAMPVTFADMLREGKVSER